MSAAQGVQNLPRPLPNAFPLVGILWCQIGGTSNEIEGSEKVLGCLWSGYSESEGLESSGRESRVPSKDEKIFGAALSSCEQCGRWQETLALLASMVSERVAPSCTSYSYAAARKGFPTAWEGGNGCSSKFAILPAAW